MEIRQLDFLLAHPQDDVEGTIFMWLPKGFELGSGKTQHTDVLQLLKNIYSLKQAGWGLESAPTSRS